MMAIGPGELLLLLVMCAVPAVGIGLLVLLINGTRKKTDMGINLQPPSGCPRCGVALPAVRAPKNFKQMMWGGWTCSGCQLELDKWGRPRAK